MTRRHNIRDTKFQPISKPMSLTLKLLSNLPIFGAVEKIDNIFYTKFDKFC